MQTLSLTLLAQLENIIEDQAKLTTGNTNAIHTLALDHGLDTTYCPRQQMFNVIRPTTGAVLVSFLNGFSRVTIDI